MCVPAKLRSADMLSTVYVQECRLALAEINSKTKYCFLITYNNYVGNNVATEAHCIFLIMHILTLAIG